MSKPSTRVSARLAPACGSARTSRERARRRSCSASFSLGCHRISKERTDDDEACSLLVNLLRVRIEAQAPGDDVLGDRGRWGRSLGEGSTRGAAGSEPQRD